MELDRGVHELPSFRHCSEETNDGPKAQRHSRQCSRGEHGSTDDQRLHNAQRAERVVHAGAFPSLRA